MTTQHTPTPWTDRAIDALRGDAFRAHTTIWGELRRIESEHGKLIDQRDELVAALQRMTDLFQTAVAVREARDGKRYADDREQIAIARAALAKVAP